MSRRQKRREAKRKLQQAEERRDVIRELIAELQAEAQEYEQKAGRADEKAAQEGRSDESAKRLEARSRELAAKEAEVRKEIKHLRGRARRAARSAKRWGRRLRRLWRPRIIELELDFGSMAPQQALVRVIGHYTAGPQDEDTEDAIRLCRIYHQAHRNKGWAGEAYLLCFTVDGDIILLRPIWAVGAHTYGYNTGSLGPMCHGTTGNRPTFVQRRAMRYWARRGHTVAFPRSHRSPRRPGDLPWYGHKTFGATACPGSFEKAYESKGRKG